MSPSVTDSSALELEDLTFSYPGLVVLDRLALQIVPGELAVVTGPSGVGKTTLLQVIHGDDQPESGTITLGGRVLAGPRTDVPPDKRPIALVAQGAQLDPQRKVGTIIAGGLPKRLRMLRTGAARVASAFDLVRLPDVIADRTPRELSVGERQRVALARGLVRQPELLLLDEPFFGLDAQARSSLIADVRQALQQTRTTTIMVTHDDGDAEAIGDRVYRLEGGRLNPA